MRHLQTFFLAVFGAAAAVGCSADQPMNPTFALTCKDAKAAIRQMNQTPKPLDRPVLVLGGFHDPGVATGALGRRVRKATQDERVIEVPFFGNNTFAACRDKTVKALEKRFPSDDPNETVEVDVIAISMGGLVARFASLPPAVAVQAGASGDRPPPPPTLTKRLRIARLFTISTPHRGATMAQWPTLQQTQIDMRAGSDFLRRLNSRFDEHDYAIYPYVRLRDGVVGAENARPPGREVWWVPVSRLQRSHLGSPGDKRIMADILRRLRGDKPFTTDPPAALPGE